MCCLWEHTTVGVLSIIALQQITPFPHTQHYGETLALFRDWMMLSF